MTSPVNPRRVAAACVLTAALAAPAVPAAAAPAVVPDPAVHYAFDDATPGSVVTDSSGNGRDATLVNVATASVVDGAVPGSRALVLPGGAPSSDGAFVTLPRPVLEGTTDLTVSTRVRWDGGTAPWQWLVALGTDNSRYLFTTPASGDGPLRTAITTVGGGSEARVTGSAALPTAGWHTVTTTLDTTADVLTTYLDGASIGSVSTPITAGELLTAAATQAGFLGRSFYGDPLFAGAIDDFAVYHAALSAEQVGELVGDVPQPTGITQDTFAVTTAIDQAPALPATVTATFSDGYDRPVPVTWDAVDPSAYADRGTFTVQGTAAGSAVTANVRVIRPGELIVDLGTDTGAFHGGASGTLYGVYGQDLPTNNLLEGMHLRTVSTKAQDGPQHPGADALEVVKPLADSTDGDVYIYMTDIHRGFPYQWEGSTPQEKVAIYREKVSAQVDQVLQLDPEYQDNVVFVPFNEPEGNMFGTGEWSYDGTSWLSDPTDYFATWDDFYRLIKGKMPDARIAGPNTSILFGQVKGFLEHTVEAGTVPDVMTWHELSDPAKVTSSVATYRSWEPEVFAGTAYEGTELPININEYAFNYHTSVPGQMIQWVSAIEAAKVDADIAYWNIDGNLSDSAVQANRANGQWWLLNAYGSMTGHTVEVTPPSPATSYTLQGVATLDEKRKQARLILGGADGPSWVQFDDVPKKVFGTKVHALVREIRWTGQIGDSAQPEVVAELDLPVSKDGSVVVPFGSDTLPALQASSAYEVVLTPGKHATSPQVPPTTWRATYEAEDAAWTGTGYSRNGPEGTPTDVGRFFTSGSYNVGGLRAGSDVTLSFEVDVPQDGTYDLSVFANSLNTYPLVAEQGPTNVFLTVDDAAEQELFLPLGYKWVVWDHTDTQVALSAGRHTLRLAAKSLDGTRSTLGDSIVDKLDLSLANPAAAQSIYEAELAELTGAKATYDRKKVSGSGTAELRRGDEVTFWVYSRTDGESTLRVDTIGAGDAVLAVNGTEVADVKKSTTAQVVLSGGINKVTVTGGRGTTVLDRLRVEPTTGTLVGSTYEAEAARLGGTAAVADRSLASGGQAVTGIGGEPGNANTLTFDVTVKAAGRYALTVRYANPEQSPATHYNPDPLARHADLSVNGKAPSRIVFPHTFHQNNFWELTVQVDLKKGANTLAFSSQELPSFDGTTLISDTFPDVLLRSQYAPDVDAVTVTPFSKVGKGRS
ncbi:LamG-like jellyroll fold domain-containing protein [Cellulomonas sp. Leaf334]|uniref:LamG-like jellyroll fold domain-containing protein n=1 Tax=Cellulomonas sp. Leaf334 TaxID=1736339 RepID=UPI0006FB2E54|nr:LamG-like jellyroll fold domain-containing protein [Cellulomonas sp. Leaf334]KQR17372.1 cellulosome enzyme [Cellulomonas sp. Leaf334]